jgi:hypothetical protein
VTEIDDDNPVSDGGVDTRASPGDLLDESSLSPERFAENTLGLDTLATLLNNPPLTRVYVYICYWGPTTVPEVVEELDLSKSTAYEYVDRLVECELVDREESTRPGELTADPVAVVDPLGPAVVTPTVLHAFALGEVDDDVAFFLDRHGLGTLVAGLRGAGLYYAGRTTQRSVAAEIQIRDTEMMLLTEALGPVLAVGRDHDPHFEYLFPDVASEMDLPDLTTTATTPPAPSEAE